jgi:hypothetical protein
VFASATTISLMALVFAIVFASVLMAWMFPNLRTSDSHAGTGPGGVSGRGVNRENGPAVLCIA